MGDILVRITFVETGFVEDKAEGEAYLDLDEQSQIATLSFAPDAGLVTKRMAGRQARGICKTGFQLRNGARIGVGFNLEVQEGESIGETLLQEGHKYRFGR